jgi:tRNA-dihydrouridine synthase
MFLNILDGTLNEIKHPVVFSGDIMDSQSFLNLSARYPQIDNWMIGRGILTNPALPEIILGKMGATDAEVLRSRQLLFHQELYCEIKAKFQRSQPVLNKMKDYWSYFSRWFVDSEALFLKLAHHSNLDDFMDMAKRILNEQSLAAVEGRTNRQVKVGGSANG